MYTVYPSSSLHLLASYRPLLYIERPDSLFFSKLSSSGFFYPGRGVSVTCVSCDNSVELIRFVSEPSSAIYHTPGCEYIKEDNDDVSSNTALSQSDASRPFCLPQDATNGVHGNTVPSLSSNSQAPELSLPASSSQAPELSLPASSSQAPELSLPASSSQAPELSLPASSSHTNCHRNGENQNISSVANLLSTANPAYPVYSESSKRFQSFVNWPNSHDQSSTALVNAGFFYAGYSDCVRCFYCGLGLRSWKPGDDIFVEHERYRPTCLYLQTLSKNKTRDTVSRCIVENDTTNINSELERVSSVPSSTETMQQPTTTNLQRSADNRRHLSRNDETQVQVTQHSVTNEVTQVEVTQHEVTNEVTKALENSLTSASEIRNLQNVTKTLLQRENQALKQLMKCKACNVAPIQDLFLPCGEMYTCKDCSNKFTHCPSCGKRILGTVTVFFS
ncbi:hypothetical protein Btru_033910 [Bulinus truncatus]|nr:hypothetical protein Btru_033910 [Bulinus truncatus]